MPIQRAGCRVSATRCGRTFDVRFALLRLLLAATLCLIAAAHPAAAASIRDESVMVQKGKGLFSVQLETRLYAPTGTGPFPLVVINHGKELGDPHFQLASQYYGQALEFVRRGYAVVVPMREGFAGSGGFYPRGTCNIESNGLTQADDVLAAIDWAKTLPYVDGSRIVVIGQSHGGLVTIALGSLNPPGVLGLVNFAGGLHFDNCPGAQRNLVTAFGSYGHTTHVPSLWMYGDNDSLFPPPLVQQMLGAYNEAGGHAKLIDFGTFGTDAHTMFGSYTGTRVWLPAVQQFFVSLGLPFDVRYDLRAQADGPDIEDTNAVPYLNEKGRAIYRQFLWASPPRAFAMSPNGHEAYWSGPNAQQHALADCARFAGMNCTLYAVDQNVVAPARNGSGSSAQP
jgi:dienelactone hydrolase